jgi:arsenate reductase
VMQEEGIDMSGARPQKLTSELAAEAQLLITLGCGDECPYVPGVRRDDWPLDDPKGQPIERVRAIRDDTRARRDLRYLARLGGPVGIVALLCFWWPPQTQRLTRRSQR